MAFWLIYVQEKILKRLRIFTNCVIKICWSFGCCNQGSLFYITIVKFLFAHIYKINGVKNMIVNDKMQQGYEYEIKEPMGQHFASEFKPELSPKQMLELGVFEGHYLTDCKDEFPPNWFENARLSPQYADVKQNYFGVKSRLTLSQWKQKGWIIGPDVRGWFQWYCRYYIGRRLPIIDEIQIKRWKAFRRHYSQISKNCLPFDLDCRRKQRQALLQWAYNPFF